MEMDDALPLNERSKNVTPHGKIASRNHDEAAVELVLVGLDQPLPFIPLRVVGVVERRLMRKRSVRSWSRAYKSWRTPTASPRGQGRRCFPGSPTGWV